MNSSPWLIYALLGAFFAGLVNVLSKRALDAMDALLALTIQATLMLLTLCVLASVGRHWKWADAPRGAIALMAVSGVSAGLAWHFGYRALQLSDVNHASPIDKLSLVVAIVLAMVFLRERPSALNWVGIALMLLGAFFVSRTRAT